MTCKFTALCALLSLLLVIGPACASPQKKPGPDSIIVGTGDSVVVSPPGTTIKVLSLQTKKGARFEVADPGGKRIVPLTIGQQYAMGDYILKLIDVVKLSQFSVVYAPPVASARTLITSHGWHQSSAPKVWKDAVPKPLGGPAWSNYERASAALGFDLAMAAGQPIEMRRYTVDEKTRTGQAVYAYMAIFKGRIVGTWMSSEAPVAPGIVPLDSKAALKW